MAKVLVVGDSPTMHTGFSRVVREICNELIKQHEIKVIGWCYKNEKHDFPYQIISPIDLSDYYGVRQTYVIVDSWQPDIVLSVGDPHMVSWIPQLPNRNKFKWIGYYPLDAIPLPKQWYPIFENMDVPVVYSKFAYRLMKESLPHLNTQLILHGVDIDTFYPLDEKEIKKFKKKFNIYGKYIVGIVGRNQWRKNLPDMFRAFEIFSKDKSDVFLYYHGAKIDQGWSIPALIERFNIQNKVLMINEITPAQGISESDLNKIYNMFDVLLHGVLGGGYELPVAEANACGIPPLVTNFSAMPEIVEFREDQLIKVANYYCPPSMEKDGVILDYALADVDDMVNKLNKFYYNRELKKKYGELGRQWALKNQWKHFMPIFNDVISELINK